MVEVNFEKKMKENGFKLTHQRLAIIEVISANKGQHFSSEEIYDIVRVNNADIGLATVYRTLQLLEKLDIVTSHNFEDGCTRYELYEEDGGHNHHHLICKECGRILEVEDDLLDILEKKIESEYNFHIVDHKLKFYGLCQECK